jgi:hypothetical protein
MRPPQRGHGTTSGMLAGTPSGVEAGGMCATVVLPRAIAQVGIGIFSVFIAATRVRPPSSTDHDDPDHGG